MILLDTDTCVGIIRRKPVALDLFAGHGPAECRLPAIVVAVLRFGALRSVRPTTLATTLAFLAAVESLASDARCAEHHAEVRHYLASGGTPIGPNDLLVAATASAYRLTLVTANRREYDRVPGLHLETWR